MGNDRGYREREGRMRGTIYTEKRTKALTKIFEKLHELDIQLERHLGMTLPNSIRLVTSHNNAEEEPSSLVYLQDQWALEEEHA